MEVWIMEQPDLTDQFVELIRLAATDLRPDVENALRAAREQEEAGSAAQGALDAILENIRLARQNSTPICQDTGTPIFYVYYPSGWSTLKLRDQIRQATATATAKSYLRPNAVDSLSGRNSGNNLGDDFPSLHFHEWEEPSLKVSLMLKGGGCENVGVQYKLPNVTFNAGRDLEGVRRVVLDAVNQAQGLGCAPGIIGVAIGGDRGAGYIRSKEQFFRPLDDLNEVPELAELETRLTQEANQLGIGPMGFGGQTTVLGVKVDTLHRLPASYFVTASYMCWADRRRTMTYRNGEIAFE
jgi:fumarate hydratase class I